MKICMTIGVVGILRTVQFQAPIPILTSMHLANVNVTSHKRIGTIVTQVTSTLLTTRTAEVVMGFVARQVYRQPLNETPGPCSRSIIFV